MKPLLLIGAIFASSAIASTVMAADSEEASVSSAIAALTDLCPAIVARNDGVITAEETKRFQLSEPVVASDRTIWKLNNTDQAVAIAWLPLRKECSVMHSGVSKDTYFVELQDQLAKQLGYTQTLQDEDAGYVTRVFSRQVSDTDIATHVVIVKTKDGRWVNAWYGNGKL